MILLAVRQSWGCSGSSGKVLRSSSDRERSACRRGWRETMQSSVARDRDGAHLRRADLILLDLNMPLQGRALRSSREGQLPDPQPGRIPVVVLMSSPP